MQCFKCFKNILNVLITHHNYFIGNERQKFWLILTNLFLETVIKIEMINSRIGENWLDLWNRLIVRRKFARRHFSEKPQLRLFITKRYIHAVVVESSQPECNFITSLRRKMKIEVHSTKWFMNLTQFSKKEFCRFIILIKNPSIYVYYLYWLYDFYSR